MNGKKLEDRTTINNNVEEVKAVPTVNIKSEPRIEREAPAVYVICVAIL